MYFLKAQLMWRCTKIDKYEVNISTMKTISTMMTILTMMTISTMMTILFGRKLEVVHKHVVRA